MEMLILILPFAVLGWFVWSSFRDLPEHPSLSWDHNADHAGGEKKRKSDDSGILPVFGGDSGCDGGGGSGGD